MNVLTLANKEHTVTTAPAHEVTRDDVDIFGAAWQAEHDRGSRSGRDRAGVTAVLLARGLEPHQLDERAFNDGAGVYRHAGEGWIEGGLRVLLARRLAPTTLPAGRSATASAADVPDSPLAQTVTSFGPASDPVSDLQIVLMRQWAQVDPGSDVAQHPTSYVETFRDLAKAALTHLGLEATEVNRTHAGS